MKYKLLKDLPGAKAGSEIIWELGIGYTIEGVQISFGGETILSNPDWFSPIDSTCGKCWESGIDESIDVRYEQDVVDAFNKFIKKWCGKWYPHLIDDDENDGQFMREKIEALLPKPQPKEEKIEMPRGLVENILVHAETSSGESVRFSKDFIRWMKQVTNKLNGDN